MAVFEFSAISGQHEGIVEAGTIVARDRLDAFDKLKRLDYEQIQLRRVEGMNGFLRSLTADIR